MMSSYGWISTLGASSTTFPVRYLSTSIFLYTSVDEKSMVSKSLLIPDPRRTVFWVTFNTGTRVQKTLNFSYEPYPDISNFPTFSGTRQPDLGAKSNYFATKKTEKG